MEAADLILNAIELWRKNKGKGSFLVPYPIQDKLIALGVLQRIYNRSPATNSIIICDDYNLRHSVINFLTKQENQDENNQEFKSLLNKEQIQIVDGRYSFEQIYKQIDLVIIYHSSAITWQNVAQFVNRCKFVLILLDGCIKQSEYINQIYKIAPFINAFPANEVTASRTSSPVEENVVGVEWTTNDAECRDYQRFSDYIKTSLNIFGSFDIMQQAHMGNKTLNISAKDICNQIAAENGWHEFLDKSIEINNQIDELFNPMALNERTSLTYDYIRKRNICLSDFDGKLYAILDIVQNYRDKKILIISKRSEFATKVTSFINVNLDKEICMNYHDRVEPIPKLDAQGNYIYYKSGDKKGQIKYMGAQAQKTYAVNKFNSGEINILSTNSSPNKELSIDVDIVIITSPLCNNLKDYRYRLDKVNLNQSDLKLFTLYIKGTNEQKLIDGKLNAIEYSIKDSLDDTSNSDFIIVD